MVQDALRHIERGRLDMGWNGGGLATEELGDDRELVDVCGREERARGNEANA